MPLCKVKDVGQLVPAFTPNSSFRLEVTPPAGILKRLDIYTRGSHETAATTLNDDAEWNVFSDLRITFNRKTRPPVLWNMLPRDLKYLTQFFEGALPPRQAVVTDDGIHFGKISVYLAPPDHIVDNPNEWGLNTAELSGPIIIGGQYAGVTSFGAAVTVVVADTNVSACVLDPDFEPSFVMSGNRNRINHENAARQGPTQISVGNQELLWGVMIRQHDNSAAALTRVDGLVTRYTFDHSADGILTDQIFIMEKKRSQQFFRLANAEVPAGIALIAFNEQGTIEGFPSLLQGATLSVIHDSAETVPVEVTDITPATGDATFISSIGAQFTEAGVKAIEAEGFQL